MLVLWCHNPMCSHMTRFRCSSTTAVWNDGTLPPCHAGPQVTIIVWLMMVSLTQCHIYIAGRYYWPRVTYAHDLLEWILRWHDTTIPLPKTDDLSINVNQVRACPMMLHVKGNCNTHIYPSCRFVQHLINNFHCSRYMITCAKPLTKFSQLIWACLNNYQH